MIYTSIGTSSGSTLVDRISALAESGLKNIELSGGTPWYSDWENDLKSLRDTFDLQFLCHNYFPPPPTNFVLNLASLDESIYHQSITHVRNALAFCERWQIPKYGVHAGFLVDIPTAEIGSTLTRQTLADKQQARHRFLSALKELIALATGTQLYIENNVLSQANYQAFGLQNPLLLVTATDYQDLKKDLPCPLLLDIGHLKVSAQTLGLTFNDELTALMGDSDYLHLSDNDGKSDTNQLLSLDSSLWHSLKGHNLSSKTLTLEMSATAADLSTLVRHIEHEL